MMRKARAAPAVAFPGPAGIVGVFYRAGSARRVGVEVLTRHGKDAFMEITLPRSTETADDADRLGYARWILQSEAAALDGVARRLDEAFLRAVDLLFGCRGRVAVTGTGKSADVGQKIAGTLNSTGTRAYVLDATRAMHGDLGMVHPEDVALVLSYSGESEEIVRLLEPLRRLARSVVALTGHGGSTLARQADVAVVVGPLEEVCPLGLAPSTSATAMMAVGDALAFVLSRITGLKARCQLNLGSCSGISGLLKNDSPADPGVV